MSNESISAVFLGNFALLVGKEMICVLEKKRIDGRRRRRRMCKTEKERERVSLYSFSSHECYLMR